jgi:hypothetical protein
MGVTPATSIRPECKQPAIRGALDLLGYATTQLERLAGAGSSAQCQLKLMSSNAGLTDATVVVIVTWY